MVSPTTQETLFRFAGHVLESSPSCSKDIFLQTIRRGLLKGQDVLGEMYSRIGSAEQRRVEGVPFAPPQVACAMVEWAKTQRVTFERIVDPPRAARAMLTNGMGGRSLHFIYTAPQVFTDAMTSVAIVCFEIGFRRRSLMIRRVNSPAQLGRLKGGRNITFLLKKLRP